MLAALAAPVTQKIHRHLLLTFTAAFVSGAEHLCAAERSAAVVGGGGGGGVGVAEAETKSAYLRLCVCQCGLQCVGWTLPSDRRPVCSSLK